MEVLKARAALLSNHEVLTLLRELENDYISRTKTAVKIKKEEESTGNVPMGGKDPTVVEISENLRTIEVEAIQYLSADPQPTPYQTPNGIQDLVRKLAPYNLTKAEKLQIVNIAPSAGAVLWAIIEEMEDRISVDQMSEILAHVQQSLTRTPQLQLSGNGADSGLAVSSTGAQPAEESLGDADGEGDLEEYDTTGMQFDDTGEGVGVEGDLDVEED